jgi:hypothetical protein
MTTTGTSQHLVGEHLRGPLISLDHLNYSTEGYIIKFLPAFNQRNKFLEQSANTVRFGTADQNLIAAHLD